MRATIPNGEGSVPLAGVVLRWLLVYGPAMAYETLGSLN